MKKTVDYYKKVVKRAESESARASIVAGKQRYEHECELLKGSYGEGITGETGYEEGLARLKAELDAKIESAQYSVLEVLDEYSVEMKELGRLDGNMIDDGTMKLLNSGLNFAHEDWQELADKHADNAIMSRVLKERYAANHPAAKGLSYEWVEFHEKLGRCPLGRSDFYGAKRLFFHYLDEALKEQS